MGPSGWADSNIVVLAAADRLAATVRLDSKICAGGRGHHSTADNGKGFHGAMLVRRDIERRGCRSGCRRRPRRDPPVPTVP